MQDSYQENQGPLSVPPETADRPRPALPDHTNTPLDDVPATSEVGGELGAPPAAARPRHHTLARWSKEIAETVIIGVLIFLAVRSVVQNFQVEGASMNPTLQTEEYLLVNKAQYWELNLETLAKFIPFINAGDDPTRYIFGGPSRGDVVVFKVPGAGPGSSDRDFIKRVIGLPGETVEIHDCTVFIDGEPLDEPYILEKPSSTFGPETVPADHYFVLGDNRNNSSDSRLEYVGMVPKEHIIGKAWLAYWPFSLFGLIDNTSVDPGAGDTSSTEKDEVATAAACP